MGEEQEIPRIDQMLSDNQDTLKGAGRLELSLNDSLLFASWGNHKITLIERLINGQINKKYFGKSSMDVRRYVSANYRPSE